MIKASKLKGLLAFFFSLLAFAPFFGV